AAMSGTVCLSLQQQFDLFGNLLVGGLLYSQQSGTLTLQTAFRDTALTQPWPNPITLGSDGRVPAIYFADGTIRIRLLDQHGVQVLDADQLPVIGSSSGPPPVAPTDPNALISTGDLKVRYGTGFLQGYVRANGGTISKAGASTP